MRRPIELLAPAKDLYCGKEAILHGADAIYMGAPQFSARAAAGNSIDNIRELCLFAHLYDARVYVALNTILKDEEIDAVKAMIWELYYAGADALIIQDMGILALDIPPIPLHVSTQNDNRTVDKIHFLKEVNVQRVVLARELSLEQIKEISDSVDIPLEAFIHGALCVSYSGQCYVSEAICQRSANRGECAQLCRLPYTMVDAEENRIVVNTHLLSLKDLNRSNDLESLLDAGVSSLKIEGRLKDITYVKNITAWYRQKLDILFSRRPEYRRSSTGKSTYTFDPFPQKSFNRGFTSYFLHGRTNDILSPDTPKSLGEPMGKIKEVKGSFFTIVGSKKELHNGDGLTFFNTYGIMEGFRVNKVEGERIYPADMPSLKPQMNLFRNFDQAFDKLLSKPSAERKIDIDMEFYDNLFGFSLCLTDETNTRVIVNQSFEKKMAKNDQNQNITTQLSKLGNTPFHANHINVNLSDNWFVPNSLLSNIRRLGVEKLLTTRNIRFKRNMSRREVGHSLYPQSELTYLGNVSNGKAISFYRSHGVKKIEKAFELEHQKAVPVMFTRHCLRYNMGWCLRYQKQESPYKEPFYLCHKETRLRLIFDCKKCEMQIFLDGTNKL